ncbi:MAG: tetratricopeptide repeat protein, partial [Cyanobacteria bacterium J06600_6]
MTSSASPEIFDTQPDSAEEYNEFGNVLAQQGKTEAAISAYTKAIELEPNLAIAHNNLGNMWLKQSKFVEAAAAYEHAIELESNLAIAHSNLGNIRLYQGDTEAAIAAYETAIRHDQDYHPAKFGLTMAQLAIVYRSEQEVEDKRQKYQAHLENLATHYRQASPQEQAEAAKTVGSHQTFGLAYQGKNDVDLQRTYGSLMHQLMASRYPQWCQPLPFRQINIEQKIRLGFVCGFFHHHSVWKIPLKGWLENIDRSEFELFGYYTGSICDRQTTLASQIFDRFTHRPFSVSQWAEKISSDNLDVLIFPEFGMNSMTIKLGSLRLAPIQLAFGGHPETSGLPTIDYHLSSDMMEPANAQSHYTEKLVRLSNLAVYYQLISIEPKAVKKTDIGIADNEIMFWCCQSLFKYLPQHDDVFPRIARKLKQAKFVFIELTSELVTNVFRKRLATVFKQFDLNYQDYCIFLPRLKAESFAGTTAIADVFLDNIGWSGNNTTMESTAYNLPIVTLPGEMMRARHTTAILTMMGIQETIAESKEQYVQIAVRLGQDAGYRHQISEQIALNKHKLYQDLTPVRELENFLLQVVNKPRRHNNIKLTESFQLAEQYYRSHRLDAAQKQYLQVLEEQSDHPDALYRLGTIAQQRGALVEAEPYLRAAVIAQPELFKAWFSLGNLYQSQSQFETAEVAYRQAFSFRPDSAPICNNLGYVLQEQGNFEAAASFYQQALDLDPKCVAAKANLGNTLYAQGKLTAEQQLNCAKLNLKLGLNCQEAQDWQTAITYYRQAILMDANLAEAHFHLGMASQEQREFSEAIICFEKVLELDSGCGAAYYRLGQIHQDLGDLDLATANFKQGLKLINPSYGEAIEFFAENTATFAESYDVPAIPQGEVTVGDYQFPSIPGVSNSEKRPFWSIVIPVVNRPEYFPECLASVLAQWTNSEDMEIIVLDNGSQPAQWKIPDELGRGIIRYCRFLETIPLQENWNAAVSLCRGEWIHLLHHDDYILPDFYARLKATLKNNPESVGAVFSGYQIINENRQVLHTEQFNLNNYRGIVSNWIQQIGVVNTTSPPCLAIKRAAYEKLGGYKLDILYTCDWELYKRIASFYDWCYEPEVLAHYRRQANSITISENTNGASGMDHLRAIEISESYLPAKYREEITARSRHNYFYWCLKRATIPLRVGNLHGAMRLIQAAFKINHSPQALKTLSSWLQKERAGPLVKHLTSLEAVSEEEHILVDLARKIVSGQIQNEERNSSPEFREALQLAMQHQKDNSFAQAEKIYRQILQEQPKQPDALYGLSILARSAGQDRDAEKFLENALQSRPEFFQAWLSIGNLYQAQDRLDDAEIAYQQAIELKPDIFVTYNNLGYVLEQQGQQERAITCYQKAIEIQPNCLEANVSLGNILFARGQLSPEQQIRYAILNNDLGFNCQSKNNLDTAIVYYRQAIALQPDLASAHYNLGTIWQVQEQPDLAVASYKRALSFQPESAGIHYAIANILQRQDKYELASDSYQKAMEVKHSSLEVIERSPYNNIYYCCIQKTASQWFRAVFDDSTIYQYTGLVTRPYVQLGLRDARSLPALPSKTIGTHLYINYQTYLDIPKLSNYTTFFVLRDPRDAVVSWYFSAKYSHISTSVIPELRRDLAQLDLSTGLKYMIDRLSEFGYFEAQKSWMNVTQEEQENIAIFRYEDLVNDNSSFLRKLLNYLQIEIPEAEFIALCDRYKFETVTKGRAQGEENINSHYRKGIAG